MEFSTAKKSEKIEAFEKVLIKLNKNLVWKWIHEYILFEMRKIEKNNFRKTSWFLLKNNKAKKIKKIHLKWKK